MRIWQAGKKREAKDFGPFSDLEMAQRFHKGQVIRIGHEFMIVKGFEGSTLKMARYNKRGRPKIMNILVEHP